MSLESTRHAFVLVSLAAPLFALAGCENSSSEDVMRTQSGDYVTVRQDYVGDGVFVREKKGDPYYYDNGAKVYVNQGAGAEAPSRPTNWDKDNLSQYSR